MLVLERVRRSRVAQEGERKPARSTRRPPQRRDGWEELGNQARLRTLAARRARNGQPEAQSPDTPEGQAEQTLGLLQADPTDFSAQARTRLNAAEPEERGARDAARYWSESRTRSV